MRSLLALLGAAVLATAMAAPTRIPIYKKPHAKHATHEERRLASERRVRGGRAWGGGRARVWEGGAAPGAAGGAGSLLGSNRRRLQSEKLKAKYGATGRVVIDGFDDAQYYGTW
jgi:hypothetical protein